MTITIEIILDTITEQAKAHDEFIGTLLQNTTFQMTVAPKQMNMMSL